MSESKVTVTRNVWMRVVYSARVLPQALQIYVLSISISYESYLMIIEILSRDMNGSPCTIPSEIDRDIFDPVRDDCVSG